MQCVVVSFGRVWQGGVDVSCRVKGQGVCDAAGHEGMRVFLMWWWWWWWWWWQWCGGGGGGGGSGVVMVVVMERETENKECVQFLFFFLSTPCFDVLFYFFFLFISPLPKTLSGLRPVFLPYLCHAHFLFFVILCVPLLRPMVPAFPSPLIPHFLFRFLFPFLRASSHSLHQLRIFFPLPPPPPPSPPFLTLIN